MNKRAKTDPHDVFNEIATVRVELEGSRPLIWREAEVPTSITLKVLHDVIQAVMSWFDSHLWQFTIAGKRYGPPVDLSEESDAPIDAMKVRLRDVLKSSMTRIDYIYDFGDSWEHRLVVKDIRQGEPGVSYPRYVAGQWNSPLEDCGGLPGFYEILDAFAHPDHPNHAEAAEWFEEDQYDPKMIEELPIRSALSRIANRRNAVAARLAKKKSAAAE